MKRGHKTPARADAMRRLEHGYAMLAMLALLAVAATGAVVVWATPHDDALRREQRTAAALAVARDALLGRAASDNNRPGSLPCPDLDDDGDADGTAGNCPGLLGRLPWRTLNIADVRDGYGERLWYALSSAYRDYQHAGILNSDTPGAYTVTDAAGAALATQAPALLVAPGPVVGSQVRDGANRLSVAMFLEGANADGDATYVSAPASPTFNDRVVPITRDDVFRAVAPRIAREARALLERYRAANGYYPAANPYSAGAPYYCDPATFQGRIPETINSGAPAAGCTEQAGWDTVKPFPDWFFDHRWHLLAHYAVAPICTHQEAAAQTMCTSDAYDTGGTLRPGSPPLSVPGITSNGRVVVIVTGPARDGQTRPCAAPGQCVDDTANADGDSSLVVPSRWPASNDRMAVSCATASPCPANP